MRYLFFGLILLASLASAEPEAGRRLFDAYGCRACHRVGPSGGNAGPDLTLVGFRRSREWLDLWLRDPAAWDPRTLMPDYKLSPGTRAALVEYLVSLDGRDSSAGPKPWDRAELEADAVARGRVIFNRAGCVGCHGAAGCGGHPNNNVPGRLIPSLDHAAETFTAAELERKIREGARPQKEDPAGPDPLVAMPAWGRVLSKGEIESVAEYLLSLKAGSLAEW